MQSVYFGGSRSLTSSSIIPQVVAAVIKAGNLVHVGCSAGADSLVISSAIRSSSFLQVAVFAAFQSSGLGSWALSAVQVVQSFAKAGGVVHWLAGGGLAVPLRARLFSRSLAGLAGCSAAVFFSAGSGSLAVAGAAAARGIPVFCFSSVAPAAPRGAAGSWVAGSFAGFACFVWQSAQQSLF